MKKNFIALTLFLCSAFIYSLDAKYFQNNQKIDHLYVNASDGLRIRRSDDLSAMKIGILYDRMMVKVVSVGKEVTIDGIKSNWVQILLPMQTLKAGRSECGWVFGGYLSDKPAPFSTNGWTDSDLTRYLSRFSWVGQDREYYEYDFDGSFIMSVLESGVGGEGNYSVSMRDKTITVKARYGGEEYVSETQIRIYKIIKIEEDKLTLRFDDEEFTLIPSITHGSLLWYLTDDDARLGPVQAISFNALMFPFSSDLIKTLGSEDFLQRAKNNLIKMGIYVDDEDYKKDYNSYWN